jgi:hypothetical protein
MQIQPLHGCYPTTESWKCKHCRKKFPAGSLCLFYAPASWYGCPECGEFYSDVMKHAEDARKDSREEPRPSEGLDGDESLAKAFEQFGMAGASSRASKGMRAGLARP